MATGQIWPATCYLKKKKLFEHKHTYLPCVTEGCFSITVTEFKSRNRDSLVCKVEIACFMVLYRKMFPNPVLDRKLHEGRDIVNCVLCCFPSTQNIPGIEELQSNYFELNESTTHICVIINHSLHLSLVFFLMHFVFKVAN